MLILILYPQDKYDHVCANWQKRPYLLSFVLISLHPFVYLSVRRKGNFKKFIGLLGMVLWADLYSPKIHVSPVLQIVTIFGGRVFKELS